MKPRSIWVAACAAVAIAGLAVAPGASAKTKTMTKTRVVQNATPAAIPPEFQDMANSIFQDGIGSSSATLNAKGTVSRVTVGVQIAHPQTFDLSLRLFHGSNYVTLENGTANGSNTNLGSGTGCAGGMTVFDSSASKFMFDAANPFDGTFLPAFSLDAFNGDQAKGAWTLSVQNQGTETGTINCVQTTVTFNKPAKKSKKKKR